MTAGQVLVLANAQSPDLVVGVDDAAVGAPLLDASPKRRVSVAEPAARRAQLAREVLGRGHHHKVLGQVANVSASVPPSRRLRPSRSLRMACSTFPHAPFSRTAPDFTPAKSGRHRTVLGIARHWSDESKLPSDDLVRRLGRKPIKQCRPLPRFLPTPPSVRVKRSMVPRLSPQRASNHCWTSVQAGAGDKCRRVGSVRMRVHSKRRGKKYYSFSMKFGAVLWGLLCLFPQPIIGGIPVLKVSSNNTIGGPVVVHLSYCASSEKSDACATGIVASYFTWLFDGLENRFSLNDVSYALSMLRSGCEGDFGKCAMTPAMCSRLEYLIPTILSTVVDDSGKLLGDSIPAQQKQYILTGRIYRRNLDVAAYGIGLMSGADGLSTESGIIESTMYANSAMLGIGNGACGSYVFHYKSSEHAIQSIGHMNGYAAYFASIKATFVITAPKITAYTQYVSKYFALAGPITQNLQVSDPYGIGTYRVSLSEIVNSYKGIANFY